MLLHQRSGIFLSYARADGETFAATLRERLRKHAPDIVIKQDRLLLEGGVGWWKQLTAAIDSVEFLVLLMTPAAIASPMVRKEWRYARQQGVCVYPVKAAPDSDLHFTQFPRWISKAHFFDLDKEWETFIAHLRKGCDTPRVPFMPPDLPENFVPRPDEFNRLKALLLTTTADSEPGAQRLVSSVATHIAITTALSGAGGFGKTTLATALCHDEDIIQNFDDGILWVTLGQNPDVLASLATVYAALTGERPGFANIEDAAFQLGQKLEDRTCLLVIDDVWDDGHLRPFLRGGKQSARLFTTRNAEIAANAHSVNVDAMRASESLALLTNGVPGLSPQQVCNLSQRLGNWPLALEIARAMIRQRIAQGDSADRAAARLLQLLDKKGPHGLERATGDPRHRTIDSVVISSLELLPSDDRRRLAELSIFPEDNPIPLSAASALWMLDEFDAEDAAQRFGRLYLVKFDLARGTMRLHDVTQSWLATQISNAPELHSRLLAAWSDWMCLPNAYAWRWLTWHLAAAGRNADLQPLLSDPVWLAAKLAATDVNALIGDFDRLQPKGEAELIQGAIRLSSHVLAKDPDQFIPQIFGRLLIHSDKPAIQQFMASLRRAQHQPWLRPLWPAVDSPGTALVRTLSGHLSWVNCVALTSDGRRAVSGSWDNTLKIWDLETGAELRTLTGHSGSVSAVALTPNDCCAVSASYDNTLKLWHLESGAELRTLVGHSSRVSAVAITPDGGRAVSASYDDTLIIWDLETGAEIRILAGHSSLVNSVALTPDGCRAVSASDDDTLKIWNLETGEELRTLIGHSGDVNGVAITPDGRRAVSASSDKTLKVWDLETGVELRRLTGHSASVSVVALTSKDRAVSASDDKSLKIWNLETGAELRTLVGHSANVYGLAVTPDGRRALSASDDQTLKLWDLESGTEPRTNLGHSASISAVAITPDGRRAVSASHDKTLKVWNLETGAELRTLIGHSAFVSAVAITPDARRAISASDDDTLKFWDLETGAELHTMTGDSRGVSAVALTPDGRCAISASYDNTLKLSDLETGAELRTLTGHSRSVNAIALTPDGRRAVSASWDKTLKLWDLETGAELRTITGYSSLVTAVALTPDGLFAVFASDDNSLKVCDLETGAELRTLTGHSGYVSAIALTFDGHHAVSASDDHTLKVWNLATGIAIASFICDADAKCCAFADHHRILAGDRAGRLHFLALEIPSTSRA